MELIVTIICALCIYYTSVKLTEKTINVLDDQIKHVKNSRK